MLWENARYAFFQTWWRKQEQSKEGKEKNDYRIPNGCKIAFFNSSNPLVLKIRFARGSLVQGRKYFKESYLV